VSSLRYTLSLIIVVTPQRLRQEVTRRGLLQPNGCLRRTEEPGGQLDRAREDLVEILGGGELRAELEKGARNVGVLLLILVEDGFLHRDGALIGDPFEQSHPLVGEMRFSVVWAANDEEAPHPVTRLEGSNGDRPGDHPSGCLEVPIVIGDREDHRRSVVCQELLPTLGGDARPDHVLRG
jgi:hypothetical protein